MREAERMREDRRLSFAQIAGANEVWSQCRVK